MQEEIDKPSLTEYEIQFGSPDKNSANINLFDPEATNPNADLDLN